VCGKQALSIPWRSSDEEKLNGEESYGPWWREEWRQSLCEKIRNNGCVPFLLQENEAKGYNLLDVAFLNPH
jgi:hypothetical protein